MVIDIFSLDYYSDEVLFGDLQACLRDFSRKVDMTLAVKRLLIIKGCVWREVLSLIVRHPKWHTVWNVLSLSWQARGSMQEMTSCRW